MDKPRWVVTVPSGQRKFYKKNEAYAHAEKHAPVGSNAERFVVKQVFNPETGWRNR